MPNPPLPSGFWWFVAEKTLMAASVVYVGAVFVPFELSLPLTVVWLVRWLCFGKWTFKLLTC